MTLNAPPPTNFPRWVLIPIFASIGAVIFFLAVWQFLAPAERKVPVAFSDFVAEVHAGRVEENRIRDREYTFRGRENASGRAVVKEAIGPVPDQALLATLKPDDPDKALPKIYFEK